MTDKFGRAISGSSATQGSQKVMSERTILNQIWKKT